MTTSTTMQENTMTVNEGGISTPDPTDEEFFEFFDYIYKDKRGMIGKTWRDYINVLNYLLRIESSLAEQKFKEFKQKTNQQRTILNQELVQDMLGFDYYKKTAQKLDTIYSAIENKRIVSDHQRPIPFKYALNMWLSIHH